MDVDAVTLFFALLAVAAQVATVALVLPPLRRRLLPVVAAEAVRLAWVVAAVATAGSLYLSEVAGFVPCPLCWYQRIAVYPLVAVLGVASLRPDGHRVRPFASALPAVGLPISLYHAAVERFPDLDAGVCSATAPCSVVWVERFGYLTIPVMAATAQALVLALLSCVPKEPMARG